MHHTSTATKLACASAISAHVDPVMAAEQCVEEIRRGLGEETPDLVMFFVSGDHAKKASVVGDALRTSLRPGTLMGVTGEGIVGNGREIEVTTGLSVFAASMPNTTLRGFTYQQLPHADADDLDALARVAEVMGADRSLRGVVFLADPFSVPAASVVSTFSEVPRVVPGLHRMSVVGGLASASASPGANVLVLNDQVMRAGAIGVAISGDVTLDTVVSQGCRPIGTPVVVTAARRNIIQRLGGRKALDVIREVVDGLDERTRGLLTKGMFIGRVVDEYKERFGRGDFLIRSVMGVDQSSGAVAVGDAVRVGQTVQFHVRDADTAREDLELLLTAQRLHPPAAGGLLFTCNARGTKLFAGPDHDAAAIRTALRTPGDEPLPLAGFFAAGEFGPVGDRSFLHGHTASLVLLRPRRRAELA
jgi:small ligand-binding sensory domain FIST